MTISRRSAREAAAVVRPAVACRQMGDPSGDTIVALGTPPGRAALAIVRVSGPDAHRLVAARLRKGSRLRDHPPRTALLDRWLGADGRELDQVVVTAYPAHGSPTGEALVEVSLHGSPVLTDAVVDDLLAAGARAAEPGEFTRRAFLNGKLDLAQAEAVATLIDARSRTAARAALRQLEGGLSRRVHEVRGALVDLLARLEAVIDFPEEDLAAPEHTTLRASLAEAAERLARLREGVRRGRPWAERTAVILAGRPNVGKSSLFNAILGRDRSIVHPRPGTTRDVVDAELVLGDLPIRLVDTAGLRVSPEEVEAEGVRRTRDALASGDVQVVILDGTETALHPEELELLAEGGFDAPGGNGPRRIGVVNKSDLPGALPVPRGFLRVSAHTGEGLPALETAIREGILGDSEDTGDRWVAGPRQAGHLAAAADALARAGSLVASHPEAAELVAEELRASIQALDAITGARAGDEVLDVIFSTFCIGK